jgi:SAM-dependent methyltransferase
MIEDPKGLVEAGYDAIARRYLEWGEPSPARLRYLARLIALLPAGADVLELGCGAGVPCTRELARTCRVTGVDISAAQIALARQHVPQATFLQADMAALDLPPASFDAVVAFYSLIHVPRAEHAGLLAQIARWLRPGGLLLATMGAGDTPAGVEEDWLGAPMFWSHFDAPTNQHLVREAGFSLLEAEVVTEEEDGVPVSFLWVLARVPLLAPAARSQ